jgi:hypothetical protein
VAKVTVPMIRVFATALVLACCAVTAVPASAAKTPRYLWATVNVCDTSVHDNMMGVRASMPGDGDHTKMYVRFVAQYYDRAKQLWSEVKGSGISKWIYVGSGIYASRQAGYTFAFDPPSGGKTFVLRGAVDYKWTSGRRIVRTAHVITKAGHPGTKGADPATYSAATCQIK